MTIHSKARKHNNVDTLREMSYRLAKMLDDKETSKRDAAGLALQLRQTLALISELEAGNPPEKENPGADLLDSLQDEAGAS